MKALSLMTVLLCLVLTACGGSSSTVSREEFEQLKESLQVQAKQLELLMSTPTAMPTMPTDETPTATTTPTSTTTNTPVQKPSQTNAKKQPVFVRPTAPAAPTNTGGLANCIDPYTLDDLTGKSKGFWVRVSTESCAFTHRTYPDSFTTTCPQGDYIGQFVCTFDVLGDVVVHEGIGQSATVWGATIRFMPSYQGEDVCTVWHNEARDGQQRVKPFIVRFQPVPGGKTCPST